MAVCDDPITGEKNAEPALIVDPTLTSIVIGGEGSSGGTFPVTPDFNYVETERFITHRRDFEAGYILTHSRFTKGRRLYRIGFRNIKKTDRDSILSFLDARVGAKGAFTFQPVDDSGTSKARYVGGSIRSVKIAPDVYRMSMVLEELF